ncbi:sugar-binding transcriptional regulator [Noviherbaspirillum sp. DKR-6]|uniref:Sugar-binding transcriptional regulator n=2 Tax=Noviherbaspirillum pedocola TaxID=2801341 RepID=A0A934SYV9_9BURK|nr:sugar-binding transcriptional regulator [Noviherbaspirillum pedocola]
MQAEDQPNPNEEPDLLTNAITVARLYYYQQMTTTDIARELDLSRSKVSRLLSYARDNGLVEIRIHDPREHARQLESQLRSRFGLARAQVVSVPEMAGETEWLQRVASHAAAYLNTIVASHMVIGIAWGNTVNEIVARLTPKATVNVDVVQLNGSGNTLSMATAFSSEIIMRFAANYDARPQPFPVPAFFEFAETRTALWRERSVRALLALQQRCDIALFSVGAPSAGVPSHVHSGGYLEPQDIESVTADGAVGDIATVFFRADGSYEDIALNARTSGPDLALFRSVKHAICVVSGTGKVASLRAALRGGFMNELIIDEPTARLLLAQASAEER